MYLLDAGEQFLLPLEPLYAMAYRPVRREDAAEIECGRPRLPLAGHYHCCRYRWTKPSLCRSILGRPTQRHVSVVGCLKQCLPYLADLTHTDQLLQGRSSLGGLSRLPVWVQETSPK